MTKNPTVCQVRQVSYAIRFTDVLHSVNDLRSAICEWDMPKGTPNSLSPASSASCQVSSVALAP